MDVGFKCAKKYVSPMTGYVVREDGELCTVCRECAYFRPVDVPACRQPGYPDGICMRRGAAVADMVLDADKSGRLLSRMVVRGTAKACVEFTSALAMYCD